jgi:2',3'-cyclic-nucleotide 2'-phosphodiesterase (5'-nucleotidase family)
MFVLPGHRILVRLTLIVGAVCVACAPYRVSTTSASHSVVGDPAIDSSAFRMIEPYKQALDGKMNEVVGYAPEALVNGVPESTLANFFADAMLGRARQLHPDSGLVAIFNTRGLRTNLAKGEVTVRSIFELMPFDNELVFVSMKGADLSRVLDGVAEKGGAPVAGIRFALGKKKAYDITVNGQALDTGKAYTIVTSDYLANGGDRLLAGGKPLPFTPTKLLLRDVLIEHCRNSSARKEALTAKLDGRISIAE